MSVVIKKSFDSVDYRDHRLYITQRSRIEEILYNLPEILLKGMYASKNEKKDAIHECLKIMNFEKEIVSDIQVECNTEELEELKENCHLFCSNYELYMLNLAQEVVNFVVTRKNMLESLQTQSKNDINTVQNVKDKYYSHDKAVVKSLYRKTMLKLLEDFETNLKKIKDEKFSYNADRFLITESCSKLQKQFLDLSKTIDNKLIINIINMYEFDIYCIENKVCEYLKNGLVVIYDTLL